MNALLIGTDTCVFFPVFKVIDTHAFFIHYKFPLFCAKEHEKRISEFSLLWQIFNNYRIYKFNNRYHTVQDVIYPCPFFPGYHINRFNWSNAHVFDDFDFKVSCDQRTSFFFDFRLKARYVFPLSNEWIFNVSDIVLFQEEHVKEGRWYVECVSFIYVVRKLIKNLLEK